MAKELFKRQSDVKAMKRLKALDILLSEWRSFTKDDQAKFRLLTSLKVSSISFLALLILFACIWAILGLDLIFFRTQGYPGVEQFTNVFFESVIQTLLDMLPSVFMMLVCIIFLGLYVGHLLVRPFKVIGDYCEKRLEGEKASYDPDFFSDLKLLTNFSEFFFNQIEESLEKGEFKSINIPDKFTRIHKPVFERAFFVQFSLIIMMTSIGASIYLYAMMLGAYNDLVKLAAKVIPQTYEVSYFLSEQANLWDNVMIVVFSLHIILYIILAFHLYSRVSVPAFGFFATMRSFLKGNTSSRVHLVGHSYVRPHSRKFNKYLDMVESKLVKTKNDY